MCIATFLYLGVLNLSFLNADDSASNKLVSLGSVL